MSEVQMSKKKALIAASMAGLLAVSGVAMIVSPAFAEEGSKCYGVNKCKGTGECGGKGSSCAGQNECAGKGWITQDAATCVNQGGTLEPKAAE